jgi:DNA-binding GntR family transcriptional regulator
MARKTAYVSSDEQSKSERIYLDLRRRIRDLDLLPGSRLDKNAIALEFGVSRAPVSEAFSRLAEEGLVDVFPQSGTFVSPVRREDIRESLLIRTGLEVEATRRVAAIADDQLLEQLEANLHDQDLAVNGGDLRALYELDEAFHAIIFDALHAARVHRLLEQSRAILDRPRFHALPEPGRAKDTVAEHRRIADAIRTGDAELAGASMRVHLAMVARAIERDFAQMEADSRPDGN